MEGEKTYFNDQLIVCFIHAINCFIIFLDEFSVVLTKIFSWYDLIFSCLETGGKMTNRYPCSEHLLFGGFNFTLSNLNVCPDPLCQRKKV